ncbi:pseudouridine synthase [Pedobacter sp. HMF7647]|uniref:Pseudouridine synthase n=1 Tax=Hufsiella arboris TaxID=2695275 RepID=A0A7K1YCH1_9SPHI|nr:pseudouridine synthase [Hufsiella arboris]MXV51789.1 pseudouridine synthase [Hufsiella arboris]
MPSKNFRNSRDDKSKKFNRDEKPNSKRPRLFDKDQKGGFKSGSDKSSSSEDRPFGFKKKTFDKPSGFSRDDRNRSDSPRKYGRDSSTEGSKPFRSRDGEKKRFDSNERPGKPSFKGDDRKGNSSFSKPYNKFDKDAKIGKDSADRGEFKSKFHQKSSGSEQRNFSGGERKWTHEETFKTPNRERKPKENDGLIRLNRYISNAGICSRRKADELISAGVISVNGEVVSELGHKVNPAKDVVRYNNETLKREKMVYVLLNKPKDYITTTDDPHERRTVMELVEKASRERIYPVGRLDRNTTGLLLMTNDGDLADKLSHPKNNITKLYHAELNKSLTQGDLNKIAFGLELEDGFIKPDSVSYVQGASKREIGIQIHSGKNRIVRRIFEQLGYEVVKLDRAVYANLTKKDLPRGRWRYLDEKEIIQLKHLM